MRPSPLLPVFAAAALAGLFRAGPTPAPAQAPQAVESLFPASAPVPAPAPAPDPTMADALRQMQKRLDSIEARLGASARPSSVAYNLERRLADLEKRVQQLEQQVARMQTLDPRIRRLEMK